MANKVQITLSVDAKNAKKTIGNLKKEFGDLDPKIDNSTKKFSKMGAVIGTAVAAVGIRELASLTKKVFEMGSAVEETESKFVTSLGNQAEAGREFLDEYATKLGLTNQEAQDFLATQVNISKGLGFAGDAAFELSKDVTTLAGDLASFNNIPIEQTSRAIQSALVGERESLKTLGIVIRETDVVKQALLETGKENARNLTDQEKATATFNLITERAGAAVGDLERTQDSAANQTRMLKAEIGDLVNELSVLLLPALAEGVRLSLELVEGFKFWLNELSETEKAANLTATKVNTLVSAMSDLRQEIENRKLDATASELDILNEAYEATTENVRAQASALWDETYALEQQKIALEAQVEAIGNVSSQAEHYKKIGLEKKISELEGVIRSNNIALQEYTRFLNGVTTETQGAGVATESTTDSFLHFSQKVTDAEYAIIPLNNAIADTMFQLQSIDQIIAGVDFDYGDKIDTTTDSLREQENQLYQMQSAYLSMAAASRDGIRGLIKSLINQAIATQITKVLAKVPFPFNIVAAGAAGFAVDKLFDKLIPQFADGVTGFGGGMALVGERGPELVSLPQGSNVVTNQNTESIISAVSRQSTTDAVNTIGSQAPDMVGAFVEALEKAELPLRATIKDRQIELLYDNRKKFKQRNTNPI